MSERIDLQTEDLRLFVACLTEGSMSAAARTLGLTQAGASRRLQRLETALGTSVLHRTTRALRPTADGERLLAAARIMLAELSTLERAGARRATPTGEVHVSAPLLLGQAAGASIATALARHYPDLRLRLSLSNTKVDLVRAGVDVALRVGPLPSSTLLAARIAQPRVGVYVRRDRRLRVTHPSELLTQPWVGHPADARMEATGPSNQRWRGEVPFVFTCDDRVVLRAAALDGLGLVLLPTFFGDAEPGLRRIVEDWQFGKVPVHAVWLPEARHDPRVRAVLEVVTAWGREQPW